MKLEKKNIKLNKRKKEKKIQLNNLKILYWIKNNQKLLLIHQKKIKKLL